MIMSFSVPKLASRCRSDKLFTWLFRVCSTKNKRRAHKKNWTEIKIRARNVPFRKWLMNIISYFQIIYLDSTCEWNEITRNPIIHSTKSNWISFKLQKGESFLWCPHIFFFLYLFYLFWTNGAQEKKRN